MKKIAHSIFFLICISLSAACSIKEEMRSSITNDGELMININSSINQEHTKATAAGFVDGDAVGLYAVNYINENAAPGVLSVSGNQADNVKYTFNESSHKWVPSKSVYYKNVDTNVDLYLYYPHQENISDVSSGSFEVQKDQSMDKSQTALSGYEASDFLWGKAENITPVESAVAITLSHRLSAVEVVLTEGTGFAEEEFSSLSKSVIVTNTTRKATINYSTGVATPLGDPQLDGIVMCPQDDGSFRAIVIPQSVDAETRLFAITIDGVTYGFKQNAVTEYQADKQLNFTINVTKKSHTGDYELTFGGVEITEWKEDKNTHGGEARQYFVVNVTEPGTLGAQIKAMGKNPDKIKNLKVVGNVKDVDFYFMRDSMAILEAINMKEAMIKPHGDLARAVTYYDDYENYVTKYGEPDYIEESIGLAHWLWKEDGRLPDNAFVNKKTLCNFVFPEYVKVIGNSAFSNTTLSGALIIPEDVERIGQWAFNRTAITSVAFNNKIKRIEECAFQICESLSGSLLLPDGITFIGHNAFSCCNFTGRLSLPETIEYLGLGAFDRAGNFSGDLIIPASLPVLYSNTFYGNNFITGLLVFEGSTKLEDADPISGFGGGGGCFCGCNFSGELIIPEGTIEIPENCFSYCSFSKIILPESLRTIGDRAFSGNYRLEEIEFNEGLIRIGQLAFSECNTLLSLNLPSTLQTIQSNAFENCYYISNITCNATEPPTIQSNSFNGVAKDNFALEVPEASIIRYQTEVGWSDFKRITAHYDFSIGRTRMRALNEGMTRTYTLRCPAGNEWSVTDKPDWITVTPSSGTGKTDVTIAIAAMPRTNDLFEVNDGSFQYPSYANYKGRIDTVFFKLSERDYTCRLEVEQYDYDRQDGEVIVNQTHSAGNGIDVVFIGEGYDAKDIAKGKFLTDCDNGYKHLFNIEPYKSYKDYFNVYSVISQSDESGIETVNTIIANKFMKNGVRDVNAAFKWAKKASSNIDLSRTVVVLLDNSKNYYGWTYMYGDGSAMSVVPISEEAYPYDYRGLIQHEAGGHAFGKLGDEYIYHNAYITSCGCPCCDHPSEEYDLNSSFGMYKSFGWFKNLSMLSDHNQVPWSHLLYHPTYSNRVDMYEGAYMHMRGMYRSEITSCMNNNIPYFNSISRQAIVERIKDYAGETFDFNDFVSRDNFDVGTKAAQRDFDWTFGVDPKWNRGTEKGSIIYMGDHPDVK